MDRRISRTCIRRSLSFSICARVLDKRESLYALVKAYTSNGILTFWQNHTRFNICWIVLSILWVMEALQSRSITSPWFLPSGIIVFLRKMSSLKRYECNLFTSMIPVLATLTLRCSLAALRRSKFLYHIVNDFLGVTAKLVIFGYHLIDMMAYIASQILGYLFIRDYNGAQIRLR